MSPKGRRSRRTIAKGAREHFRPKLHLSCGQWTASWDGLRTGKSNVSARETGLFATRTIKAGSRIDYYGVRLTQEGYEQSLDQQYCVAIHAKEHSIVDGNPRWYQDWSPDSGPLFMPPLSEAQQRQAKLTRLPAGLLIGGACNEPVPGERLSVKLVGTHRSAFFLATRDIEPGDELLTLYGEDYAREYTSPYTWLSKEAIEEFRSFW